MGSVGSGPGPGGGVAVFVALGLGDWREVRRASPCCAADRSIAALEGCATGCARRRGRTPVALARAPGRGESRSLIVHSEADCLLPDYSCVHTST